MATGICRSLASSLCFVGAAMAVDGCQLQGFINSAIAAGADVFEFPSGNVHFARGDRLLVVGAANMRMHAPAIGHNITQSGNVALRSNLDKNWPGSAAQKSDDDTRALATSMAPAADMTSWAGINNYYLWSCNSTIRAEALNAVRAAGLKVLRVFLLSTTGAGAVAPCKDTPVDDLEPIRVGLYDDTILSRLDDLLHESQQRGIKLTVALHDRWSLGCWRSDVYQKKYSIPRANCAANASGNDPTQFYSSPSARNDFKARIQHVLSYHSKHTGKPLGQWHTAIFSIEAQNEAWGHAKIVPAADRNWLCEMSSVIRTSIHPKILVTTGGGGIGAATYTEELRRAKTLSECEFIDIIALHSYNSANGIDRLLGGYKTAIAASNKRMILQEWGVTGPNSTAQAAAFQAVAAVAAKHVVPQLFWALQPSHAPQPSTTLCLSPPSPAPSPGRQRRRDESDGEWINYCDDTSCPTEGWVTALYPAAQAAALQSTSEDIAWPEIWSCRSNVDCRFNGQCNHTTRACMCSPGWRGPTCAALRLGVTPRNAGFQHENSSSWGGSIMIERDESDDEAIYHMFASFISGGCGLDAWDPNSMIVHAVSSTPLGPYQMKEVVADRFAHEPNLVFGTAKGTVMLLGTMLPEPPQPPFPKCDPPVNRSDPPLLSTNGNMRGAPHRNTYLWRSESAATLHLAERELVVNASLWDHDPYRRAICDTNLAAAIAADGKELVGIWRRCETPNLHTIPHTLTATNGAIPSSYRPNISVNFPYMSHAGAEDPMVWTASAPEDDQEATTVVDGLVFHAILHDEQITRCADAPVGCWPGGRHAFSTDRGLSWDYSPLDAYNGTVEYSDGTSEDAYLRARPHVLVDEQGKVAYLSNGLRPTKASQYVRTIVVPVESDAVSPEKVSKNAVPKG